MASEGKAGGQKPAKKADSKRLPKNFVIAWKADEHGPTLGYAIVETVVYFPVTVAGSLHRGTENAADPAFAELFAPGVGRKVILHAVALPEGVVGDGSFRMEINGMSGDNRHLDAD